MVDGYGRTIDYMRVSITGRCNLRCKYCMPKGIVWMPMEEILTLEEITEVCRLAAELGIRKVKVTGGEPLVRLGCADLVGMLKEVPGIEQVTLTTNGIFLTKYAEELCKNGLDAVNVSLDTLDAREYAEITGYDGLADVLRGIEAMEERQIPVKINVVPQQEKKGGWQELFLLARDWKLDVRFIEMMPIGYGKQFETISNAGILAQLKARYEGVQKEHGIHGNGPAEYYNVPGFQGSIGFISAVHGKFCSQCNRIRLTAEGQLKPCLCYGEGISIKEALRAGQTAEVQRLIGQAIAMKPEGHCFGELDTITETREMARIGG